jgi:hypothetical protein
MKKFGLSILPALLLGAAMALPVGPAWAVIYNVNLTPSSTDSVVGTITTDCNNCTVAASDITGWDLTVTMQGGINFSLVGPDPLQTDILEST